MSDNPDALTQRQRIAAITAAIACVSAVGIGLSLSLPLLSLEMERMGASGAVIGLNTAVAGLASIITVPFVPRLAARFGLLPLLWSCVALMSAGLIAFKAVPVLLIWFPLRFVFSGAIGALFVISEYWINEAAPPGRRGLVMGIYATVLALGFAGGPLILLVVGSSGWAPYLAGAVLFGLAAIPLAASRGLSPQIEGEGQRTVWSFITAAPTATLGALVFGAAEAGGFALLPIYGLRIGLSESSAGLLITAVALGNVALQIPIGLLSDRMDRRRLLLALAAISTAVTLLLPAMSSQPATLLAALFVWGGMTGALYTVGLAHLGARFTGADLARANAAFVVLYNLGLMAGPPLAGAGMDARPPHGFAWALAAFFGAYTAIILVRMFRASLARP